MPISGPPLAHPIRMSELLHRSLRTGPDAPALVSRRWNGLVAEQAEEPPLGAALSDKGWKEYFDRRRAASVASLF